VSNGLSRDRERPFSLVGDTGIEPVTSSVSSNGTPTATWRKAHVTPLMQSIYVHVSALVFGVVVTQLVTQRWTHLGEGVGPATTVLIAIRTQTKLRRYASTNGLPITLKAKKR
jgi:hypothetical protein